MRAQIIKIISIRLCRCRHIRINRLRAVQTFERCRIGLLSFVSIGEAASGRARNSALMELEHFFYFFYKLDVFIRSL